MKGGEAMTDELKTYTLNEAAEVLRCTRQTVYSYVIDGRIRASKVGLKWLITRDELQYINITGLREKTK